MPCYFPLQAQKVLQLDGSYKMVFKPMQQRGADFGESEVLSLPCGRCIGCRLEHSRQWAMRIMHEAQMHESNHFLTLTYAPESLPEGGTLVKKHCQDFFKRLRRRAEYDDMIVASELRYYMCGEYGERFARPHYHVCMFGLRLLDLKVFSPGKFPLYISATLTKLWGHGHVVVAGLTFESAAYVARYCTKKITGGAAEVHYGDRLPEYSAMSTRPGIGASWYARYKGDCYPSDYLVVRGHKVGLPRYYDKLLEREDPVLMAQLKASRRERASDNPDNAPDRLLARHKCAVAKFAKKMRKYEDSYVT